MIASEKGESEFQEMAVTNPEKRTAASSVAGDWRRREGALGVLGEVTHIGGQRVAGQQGISTPQGWERRRAGGATHPTSRLAQKRIP